jgi:hypothetical protein
VTPGLSEDSFTGIDQDNGHIRSGRAGGHVAGVLLVTRRIGDDEFTMGGGEVAVRDIDGDSLLALGAQAIGELSEINGGRDIRGGRFGHGAHVIFVDVL